MSFRWFDHASYKIRTPEMTAVSILKFEHCDSFNYHQILSLSVLLVPVFSSVSVSLPLYSHTCQLFFKFWGESVKMTKMTSKAAHAPKVMTISMRGGGGDVGNFIWFKGKNLKISAKNPGDLAIFGKIGRESAPQNSQGLDCRMWPEPHASFLLLLVH